MLRGAVLGDDNIIMAACLQPPAEHNDARWCSLFACVKLRFCGWFCDAPFKVLDPFQTRFFSATGVDSSQLIHKK